MEKIVKKKVTYSGKNGTIEIKNIKDLDLLPPGPYLRKRMMEILKESNLEYIKKIEMAVLPRSIHSYSFLILLLPLYLEVRNICTYRFFQEVCFFWMS